MENETIAWLMYLLGALGLIAFVWRVTRGLKREWRYGLIATTVALLLTPAPLDVEPVSWSPAILILLLGGIFEGSESIGQPLLLLVITWLIALIVSLAVLLLLSRTRGIKVDSDA